MKNLLFCVVGALCFILLVFCGIDAEVARRDYVDKGYAEGCVFDCNCQFDGE